MIFCDGQRWKSVEKARSKSTSACFVCVSQTILWKHIHRSFTLRFSTSLFCFCFRLTDLCILINAFPTQSQTPTAKLLYSLQRIYLHLIPHFYFIFQLALMLLANPIKKLQRLWTTANKNQSQHEIAAIKIHFCMVINPVKSFSCHENIDVWGNFVTGAGRDSLVEVFRLDYL